MHARLARFLVLVPLVAATLLGAGCRCCCPSGDETAPRPAASDCPDSNLARDDSLLASSPAALFTLEGRGLFLERRPLHEVPSLLEPVARMSLWGAWRTSASGGHSFLVESIEFYGAPGELSAEDVIAKQCRPFQRLVWPAQLWKSAGLESNWDGSSSAYTLAARVVYVHGSTGSPPQRVFTLARGVFRNIQKAHRAEVDTAPPTNGDGSTISNLIVAGTFEKNNHIAHYDVSIEYSYSQAATSVEIFSAEATSGNVLDPANRILEDHGVAGSHWSATQIAGPYRPPNTPLVAVRVTYADGHTDYARRVFANIVDSDDAVILQ